MSQPALVTVILCDVFVSGHPKTKGSMEALGNGKMRDKPSARVWRKLVAKRVGQDCVKRAPWLSPHQGRIGVRIVSYMQTATGQEGWWEKAKAWLISKLCGDVDKLARCVLDALGCQDKEDAHLIGDDAQVVDLFSHKRLVQPGQMVGQQITVWVVPEDQPW